MSKLLLLSIVLATFTIPLIAARERSAIRAVRKTVLLMISYTVFYLFAVGFLL